MAARMIGRHPQEAESHLEVIERAMQRMESLIDDLVDAASIRAHGLTISRTTLDTATFVPQLIEEFRPAFEKKGVALGCQVEAQVSLSCDGRRIAQGLSNLLHNALKFTDKGGSVSLSVRADHLEATFLVQDSGSGIAADELAKVFDRAWQSEETAHLGSGMGLYITKSIVEAHGGRIWVKSEPGHGSVFAFTLPLR
jgi:signal transduction histidine kinase